MAFQIRDINEETLEDEARVCVPTQARVETKSLLERGVEEKVEWLKERLRDFSSLGKIAYYGENPIGFVECVSAKNSPYPTVSSKETALFTCIWLTKMRKQGIGSKLLDSALKQLKQMKIKTAKAVVSRSPYWINQGIYSKFGFQLEKTIHQYGCPEPVDILTLSLSGPQEKIKSTEITYKPPSLDKLPINIITYYSKQCSQTPIFYNNLLEALKKFDRDLWRLKTIDFWKQPNLVKKYGPLATLLINGRSPFFAPANQEQIENEIKKEIERIKTKAP